MVLILVGIAIAMVIVLALVINVFVQTSPSHLRTVENREADRVQAAIDNMYDHAEAVIRWQSRNKS